MLLLHLHDAEEGMSSGLCKRGRKNPAQVLRRSQGMSQHGDNGASPCQRSATKRGERRVGSCSTGSAAA